jgi:hypothetical protein
MPHELARVCLGDAKLRHSDAGRHGYLVAICPERLGKRGEELFGSRRRLVPMLHVLQQHCELVAGDARQESPRHAFGEPARDGDEHAVSDIAAEPVADSLEIIQADRAQCQPRVAGLLWVTGFGRAGQALRQQAPVGQIGYRVVGAPGIAAVPPFIPPGERAPRRRWCVVERRGKHHSSHRCAQTG